MYIYIECVEMIAQITKIVVTTIQRKKINFEKKQFLTYLSFARALW